MLRVVPSTKPVASKKYSIYVMRQGETPRRVVTDVPETVVEERISRVRNCWPQHTVFVMRIIENLSLVFAPKGDVEANCSDREPAPNNGGNNTPSPGQSCL